MSRRESGLVAACALFGALFVGGVAASSGCGSDDFADSGNGDDGGGSSSGAFVGPDTGASSSGASGSSSSGSTGPNNCTAPMALTIAPATTTQTVVPGTPFSLPFTASADGKDVTSAVNFTSSDANVGTFTGATFNWGNKFGGSLTVSAKYCGVVGTAALTLKIVPPVFTTNGASGLPADFAAVTGTSVNPACKPTLKYPPDQILLPPNTNVIEVHFLEGTNNTKFEISFQNAATDVKVYSTCTAAPLTTGPDVANGAPVTTANGPGCLFELNQQEWDYIANSNRDGDPLNVTVRALGCDGDVTKAGKSDTRSISFAREDVLGTIYYWASIRDSSNANTGGVYRYDYGKRDQTAEAVLTPVADKNGNGANSCANPPCTAATGLCVGCHVVDREGRKMVFDFDDNDSDDEYGDMWTDVWDIPSATASASIAKPGTTAFSAGYASWNRSASMLLKSDGWGNGEASYPVVTAFNGPRGTFHLISNAGAPIGKTTPTGLTNLRGSTPNISPDDKKVVFSAAVDHDTNADGGTPNHEGGPTTPGYYGFSKHDPPAISGATDEWFNGAGLYVASWDSATKTMGAATAIFPAAAINAVDPPNYYYPSWSPDQSLIAFNKSTTGGNYHNPTARFFLVAANGTTAADQVKANTTNPVENGGNITNSWVRWAPFVQNYKGKKIAWVTFSSTRGYGLRIDNTGARNCYPKENPDESFYCRFDAKTNCAGISNFDPTVDGACARANLWMAAVDLDTGIVMGGGDVSHPAFWLPFQDMTTNNHLGQWTERNFKGTCTTTCPSGYDCIEGACAAKPPTNTTPPNPVGCTADVQCANGTCCNNGTCGMCADGGAAPKGCNTCLDCGGQACKGGNCGDCTSSADCCAPLYCSNGSCVKPVN